ncbi:MAG: D-alanyl-D-alanine carboxypeptidase [Gammaproteobacteria bacterium]|nr:D-alanyl-D-alanine carboxypeptidase [Gammaproteobacteria bacterium]
MLNKQTFFKYVVLLNVVLSAPHGLAIEVVPPRLDLSAYVLMDADSGQVLAADNLDEQIGVAGLTKLMTTYVIFDAVQQQKLTPDTVIDIAEIGAHTTTPEVLKSGPRMFLQSHSKITLADLLKGLIIQNGNDAALVLAQHIAGNELAFVERMNAVAKKLGMSKTHFNNVAGVAGREHYSTAFDLALLSRALIRNHASSYAMFAEKQFVYNNIQQTSRNNLLWKNTGVDGLQTSYSIAEGYCAAISAKRNNMRLIAIVLGAGNEREWTTAVDALLEWGYRYFETHKLYSAEQVLYRAAISDGNMRKVALRLAEDLYVTVPHGHYEELTLNMAVQKNLMAPVAERAVIGRVEVMLANEVLKSPALIAAQAVPQGNAVQRLFNDVMSMFE